MTTESILEKIQKLLELQNGAEAIGSLEEANNAAEKVQRLLTKYNLDLADVSLHTQKNSSDIGKFDFQDAENKKNEGQWIFALYNGIAKHNFCRCVIRRFHQNGMKKGYVTIVGSAVNVDVVRSLSIRMEERIRTFESRAWKNEGQFYEKNRNAFRRAYFMGAAAGLEAQLRKAKEREMQENVKVNTLVIQNDAELEKRMMELFSNLTQARSTGNLKSRQAMSKGYRDGLNMPTGESIR